MSAVETKSEITISQNAVDQIRKLRIEQDLSDEFGLRIGVKGGGCSGMTYHLGFDKDKKEIDTVIEQDGIKLFVDGKSLFYLMGTELDFSGGLNGKGFIFNNPNATKTCGCGESFGV
ncbi:MAG: iron-sulfur cluster assembly accessory protein [Melioribacteraceae bacterium]|nr:iron-sulfur cluster assembly accessory protein [Melioribacteraceae bacterium]MCF8263941.1 iron-sulfur cluster assembly accessory protein [Melioribacteraceae bacterium]MCF8412302.1 iron-sulfur cluster assembly accessory protein [Melioribacteraceae bacterium]MCF8432393.1 iron-sulfur cluster assembly accessory protein [Melioribacteraceae bacterium]